MRVSLDRKHALVRLLSQHVGVPVDVLAVRRLRGGLVSEAVQLVSARVAAGAGSGRGLRIVVKTLRGAETREAMVYAELVAPRVATLAPRLLAVEWRGADACDLYLEHVASREAWPWRDSSAAAAVLEQAARVHAVPLDPRLETRLARWDYEAELRARAPQALVALDGVRSHPGLAPLAAHARAARRVTEALPRLRHQLLGAGALGRAVIHGDLHPGNVVVRAGANGGPVLLDWGRARVGSPLEDLASWLQTLRRYEPEALRLHDSIVRAYLVARGLPPTPSRETRERYWIAAASNLLAGALAYHLAVASSGRCAGARAEAASAARDALRVIRRADACSRA